MLTNYKNNCNRGYLDIHRIDLLAESKYQPINQNSVNEHYLKSSVH